MRLFSDVCASIHDPFLRRACELAQRGLGRTAPNPAVGCVVVANGEVVGEGWHERAGGPHAEVVALERAGHSAEGSTVYVTLEPCAHHGRTPPCTDALREAGAARVVIGMPDPHECASGGAEILRSSGVDVAFADDPTPFEALNEGWLKQLRTGLPLVTAKVALSLDGKLSGAEGVRTRMSSAGSRSVTMKLRAVSDTVLVGARTATIDDPSLTVRDEAGALAGHQPLRAVLCGATIPYDASLLGDGVGPVVVLVPSGLRVERQLPRQTEVLRYDAAEGLPSALGALSEAATRRVLVEPGSRLMAGLWQSGLLDELVVIHCGGVAGRSAPPLFPLEAPAPEDVFDRRFSAVESGIIDGDAVTRWRPSRSTEESTRNERDKNDVHGTHRV